MVNLQAMREGSIPLKPEYVAYNDAAQNLITLKQAKRTLQEDRLLRILFRTYLLWDS